jgi:hypothetical protein
VLGEENTFSYATNLASVHPDWAVIGTKYGNGTNSQTVLSQLLNLTLVDNVDGVRLGQGTYTQSVKFNDIVFNGPRVVNVPRGVNWKAAAGDLVENVLNSSLTVLQSPGYVRFSSGGGMPAVPRLNELVTSRQPAGYTQATRVRFLSDLDFGLSSYQPTDNY